jgi:hypothetical protein
LSRGGEELAQKPVVIREIVGDRRKDTAAAGRER